MGIEVRALLRIKGTPYEEPGLDDESLTNEQLIDAMMAHSILINRSIVVTPLGTRVCRPSKAVLNLLPQEQRGSVIKEDGQVVAVLAGIGVARDLAILSSHQIRICLMQC
jgi:arsenate reductase